jgi:hypothetical protein
LQHSNNFKNFHTIAYLSRRWKVLNILDIITRYWHMIEVMCMDYHKVSYRKHKANFLDIVKRESATSNQKYIKPQFIAWWKECKNIFFITTKILFRGWGWDNIECHCTFGSPAKWCFIRYVTLMILCMQIYSWIRPLLLYTRRPS